MRLCFLFLLSGVGLTLPAAAQISGDGTLGTRVNDSLTLPCTTGICLITGGTQPNAGPNLFHSFQQFSLPSNGTAIFSNSRAIQNIFVRVTGGNSSNIDGLIQANAPANLFFLNPAGIVFGINARLNVGGSFLATTANSIVFADGTQFSASNSQVSPVLTVSVPIGLQFGAAPGDIVNRSVVRVGSQTVGLQVSTGETLGLLGGNVIMEGGNVTAAGGQVIVGSIGSNGFVALALNTGERQLELGFGRVQTFQDIQMSNQADINADGIGGGDILVQGRSLTLDGISTISALTQGNEPGRTVTVNVEQLLLQGGSQIQVSTRGAGRGGDLIVNASDSVQLVGTSADARFASSLLARARTGTGAGGNLTVNTRRLILQEGAEISASTFTSGQAGNLAINASELISLSGTDRNGFASGLFAQQATASATGNAGSLTITTGQLSVQAGAQIGTRTRGSAGQGGNLIVNASQSIEVSGRASNTQSPSILSAGSTGAGTAGSLSISTPRLLVQDGGTISVSGTGTGAAGNLEIVAPSLILNNQGSLTAETTAGQGNITLRSQDLRLRNASLISTNATGPARGGDITISTTTLVALENSDITANAEESFGGRVSIRAQGIFGTAFRPQLTPDSDITATSRLGPQFSGSVTIQTPDVDPSQGLVQLQTTVVDPSSLVAQTCSTDPERTVSEFIITGRGGLPPSPTLPLTEETVLVDLGKPATGQVSDRPIPPLSQTPALPPTTDSTEAPLIQAQGWIVNADGKVVLLAHNPSAVPWIPGNPCPGNR
jgi:filamentous hemagglutinin family protein